MNKKVKKITVIGLGYVGLANAVMFSQCYDVCAYDTNHKVVELVNKRVPHFKDAEIERFYKKNLKLQATNDLVQALSDAKYIIIATPTDYDDVAYSFDTSSVDLTLEHINKYNDKAIVVIKSTVPIGYSKIQVNKYPNLKILFSPEFLREGNSLIDCLNPDRIIISNKCEETHDFTKLLVEVVTKKDVPILVTNYEEAEAIKLFSNTYLALRVAFFNELDTFAELKSLNVKDIIDGVSLDPRIGQYYNNPSFGYGGYCLPKDTKQLLANYENIPQNIIGVIGDSNMNGKLNVDTV